MPPISRYPNPMCVRVRMTCGVDNIGGIRGENILLAIFCPQPLVPETRIAILLGWNWCPVSSQSRGLSYVARTAESALCASSRSVQFSESRLL